MEDLNVCVLWAARTQNPVVAALNLCHDLRPHSKSLREIQIEQDVVGLNPCGSFGPSSSCTLGLPTTTSPITWKSSGSRASD